MNAFRYAILPLFALGVAVGSPVLAGEGNSPNVPPEDTEAGVIQENDRAETGAYDEDGYVDENVDEDAEERAMLPWEEDPDQNDPGTGIGGSGESEPNAGGATDDSGGTGDNTGPAGGGTGPQ